MTNQEAESLKNKGFEELWKDLWYVQVGDYIDDVREKHEWEYKKAERKFLQLKRSGIIDKLLSQRTSDWQ